MNKVCKIRFYPNSHQIKLINNTLGCCRFIKNKYIEYNNLEYSKGNKFVSGYDFSKYINKLTNHCIKATTKRQRLLYNFKGYD